jgi:eukaryotic-like serine/threonine-protein kinase
MLGDIVYHYKIIEKLGDGGMGVVYKAWDTKLHRHVALKFLSQNISNEIDKKRFIQEAQAASILDHPNICSIHEINETIDSQLFIVMSYYMGETLKCKIQRGPLQYDKVQEYAAQIAAGLSCSHSQGIIHRDIKPANIIITNDNVLKIVDFGLAKIVSAAHITKSGTTPGTILYMSPEQLLGNATDYRSDIWSFGVVLYEMLTGKPPFYAEYEQAISYSIVNDDPKPLSDYEIFITDSFQNIVLKCLQKNPENRYKNCKEIVLDLVSEKTNSSKKKFNGHFTLPKTKQAKRKSPVFLSIAASFLLLLLLFQIPPINSFIKKVVGYSYLPAGKRVAFLPIEPLQKDSNLEGLARGLSIHLFSELVKLQKIDSSLCIIPIKDIREHGITSSTKAARTLSATLTFTSTLVSNSDQYTLYISLNDAKKGNVLDTEIVTSPCTDTIQFQNKARPCIAKLLKIKDINHEISHESTMSARSNTFYLNGLDYLHNYSVGNNLDISIIQLSKSIAEDSTFSLPIAAISEAYWQKYIETKDVQWVDSAKYNIQKALEMDENSPELYVSAGRIYAGTGENNRAIENYKQAIKLDNKFFAAYLQLSNEYRNLENFDLAKETLHKAKNLEPDYWRVHHHLGYFYYAQGDLEKAKDIYEYVIELVPDNIIGYNYVASIYCFLENFSNAKIDFEKSNRIKPNYTANYNLGTIYFYEQNFNKATENYKIALDINNKDYRTWAGLAASLFWSGENYAKADSCYRKAIELALKTDKVNPLDYSVKADMAGYYVQIDEPKKALSLINLVKNSNPTNENIMFRIGENYALVGERDSAIVWLSKALEHNFPKYDIENNPALISIVAENVLKF